MSTGTNKRTITEYRGHTIVAALLNGVPQAAMFLGKSRLDIIGGKDLDDAIQKGREWVDQTLAEKAANRLRANVATVDEYATYLAGVPLKDHEVKMLRANATRGRISSSELAAAAGWADYSSANLHYGKLGREIGEALGLTFERTSDGREFFTSAIAQEHAQPGSEAGDWAFELHPEFLEALRRHRIV